MPDTMPALGAAIRYHRKAQGKSPEQVAAAAHLSSRTYRRIENDERKLDARELDAVCDALKIGVDALQATTTDPTEIRLHVEYGARLFAVSTSDDSGGGASVILHAEDLPGARTQVRDDHPFWASVGWFRDDVALEVTVASREQIETWVRDAAKALSPGGHEHEADDTMPERLARIRHHVVPVTVA